MKQNMGRQLRMARLSQEMTLKKLADLCNLSTGYISQIERGEASPSLSVLDKLAKALGLNVWRLFLKNDSQLEGIQASPTRTQANQALTQLSFAAYQTSGWVTEARLVKKDNRKTIVLPKINISYGMITPDLNRRIQVLHMEAEPETDSGPDWFVHEGEECCLVLNGRMELDVGEEKFVLETGDSLYFPSGVPHHWRNIGKEKLALLWIITPPSF